MASFHRLTDMVNQVLLISQLAKFLALWDILPISLSFYSGFRPEDHVAGQGNAMQENGYGEYDNVAKARHFESR